MRTPARKIKRAIVKKHAKMQVKARLKARANHIKKTASPKNRTHPKKVASTHKTPRPLRSAAKALAKKNAEVVEADNPEEIQKVESAIADPSFSTYMAKNVGTNAIDILRLLTRSAQTDEGLAAKLGVKINDVRRMLNVMNGYSFLRYDTNKDSKGWLIFKWRIDREKLFEFEQDVNKTVLGDGQTANCNDFFYCAVCYNGNKVVLPFDAAFETGFKCVDCGKSLNMFDKQEAKAIFKS